MSCRIQNARRHARRSVAAALLLGAVAAGTGVAAGADGPARPAAAGVQGPNIWWPALAAGGSAAAAPGV